jgi:hypothetical protein
MTVRNVTLDDLKQRPLEEVLQQVLDREEILAVRLPDGHEVTIQPSPRLKSLPVLEGSVPEGWKDATYGRR